MAKAVKKTKNVQYFEAVGRRKTSVARVRLYLVNKEKSALVSSINIKAGETYLNGKPLDKAVTISYMRDLMLSPLKLTGNENRFAVSIHVKGGGTTGQQDAVIQGLARALKLVDSDQYKAILKKEGYMTRDSRTRERRKVGTGGRARRVKQSPKR